MEYLEKWSIINPLDWSSHGGSHMVGTNDKMVSYVAHLIVYNMFVYIHINKKLYSGFKVQTLE